MLALSEVMGMTRHEMTQFEAEAWKTIMCAVPPEQFKAYLQQHVFTGSGFTPKPSEAAKMLGLAADPDTAYASVERLVTQCGPYQQPPISDPVLVSAIQHMGGWLNVCEQWPAPTESFAVKAMRERFAACFNQAMVAVNIRGELPKQPLMSLTSKRELPSERIAHQPTARLAAPSPRPADSSEDQSAAPLPSRAQRYGPLH
ncbi:hypothetical protein [Ramlibacter sp. AN1133]|uniref:hypothetical protein n=1 Tax=Ramlibacter sp. AN1133 TaxID=3133429 RepID=UPI0030C1E6CE